MLLEHGLPCAKRVRSNLTLGYSSLCTHKISHAQAVAHASNTRFDNSTAPTIGSQEYVLTPI